MGKPLEVPLVVPMWDLYIDKSLNDNRCGFDLILSSPELEHLKIEYVLRLGFKAFNNEAEYDALLAELRLVQVIRAKHLLIFSDSQLVV